MLRGTEKKDLIKFRSWGMAIRNELGLWGKNQTLIASLPPDLRWADNSSLFLIEQVWERLRSEAG